MILDNNYHNRYYVVSEEGIQNGWLNGWDTFNRNGSPNISMDVREAGVYPRSNLARLLDVGLWPDTEDYDQNSPGILNRVLDLDKRVYHSDIEKAFWVNVLRVPICASYLAACAKVRPERILELGTGGDSAHSTGMFLYWLEGVETSKQLVSVDRHPLSHAWLRYREYGHWSFIQGDSITVMKELMEVENPRLRPLPNSYDMIFIDSSHTYPHTLKEIEQASFMTSAILLDDTTVPEVLKGLEEFLLNHREWLRVDLAHGVSLIERHRHLFYR